MIFSKSLNGGGRYRTFHREIMNLYTINMTSMNYGFSKYFLFFMDEKCVIMKNE